MQTKHINTTSLKTCTRWCVRLSKSLAWRTKLFLKRARTIECDMPALLLVALLLLPEQ
jgi:hypothetical protein